MTLWDTSVGLLVTVGGVFEGARFKFRRGAKWRTTGKLRATNLLKTLLFDFSKIWSTLEVIVQIVGKGIAFGELKVFVE